MSIVGYKNETKDKKVGYYDRSRCTMRQNGTEYMTMTMISKNNPDNAPEHCS